MQNILEYALLALRKNHQNYKTKQKTKHKGYKKEEKKKERGKKRKRKRRGWASSDLIQTTKQSVEILPLFEVRFKFDAVLEKGNCTQNASVDMYVRVLLHLCVLVGGWRMGNVCLYMNTQSYIYKHT